MVCEWHGVHDGGETEDLVKKQVIFDCIATFCLSSLSMVPLQPPSPSSSHHTRSFPLLKERGNNTLYRTFWCRIHLWFRLMGGLQGKSMTSQRAANKIADMRYYDVMTTTRWRLYVTMEMLWQQRCLIIQMTLALSRMLVAYVRLLMR